MIKEISSKDNLIIKKIKQLSLKKYREKYNQFIMEGLNLIEEAIKNEADINLVIYKDSFLNIPYQEELIDFLDEKNIPVYHVPDELFEYISDTENPQGIISVVMKPVFDFSEIFNKPYSNVLLIDKLQDPGNMGTILRTADASGIDGVIVMKGSVDLYLSKTVRSAAGSVFRVPILIMDDAYEAISLLRKYNKKILATSPRAKNCYYDVNISGDTALVIGNEANGVSEEFMSNSDYKIKIPMLRDTESLNASIAAAVIMYEMVRQRATLK
ncbi:MAG: RNA methyltransferase [Clostridiales bacterium]|nr:RNA methyltransferase [Clostridiales bacterium]